MKGIIYAQGMGRETGEGFYCYESAAWSNPAYLPLGCQSNPELKPFAEKIQRTSVFTSRYL
jgi:hypothetical protein